MKREVYEHFRRVHEPSAGTIGEPSDVRVSPDGGYIALAGSVYDPLTGPPRQRIAVYRLSDRRLEVIGGNANDTMPRWSPRNRLAFLSDRTSAGQLRLHFCDPETLDVSASPMQEAAELLAWAPSGERVLVQTVAPGAHRAGAAGSGTVSSSDGDRPSWMPENEAAAEGWRRLWIYTPAAQKAERAGPDCLTIWEAEWCGNDAILAIVSNNPREGAWHNARLIFIGLEDGQCETIYEPVEEIGVPVTTADGRYVAFIEGCCSDRTIVAGDVIVLDRFAQWNAKRIDIEADVTHLTLRDGNRISFAGLRGVDTVAGEIEAAAASASICVKSDRTWLRRYPAVAPIEDRAYVTVQHSYDSAPKLVRLAAGSPAHVLHDLENEGTRYLASIAGNLERLTWDARDGLRIQGFLAKPSSPPPYPLVVAVHGGPVWAFTDAWQMFMQLTPLLVSRGYAVLHPNPRGSSGRGQAFTRLIRGEIGGEERHDILQGVDMLVHSGVADANRLAIMGASHGGYMSAWMVTQTDRFAAAIAIAPVTDLISLHYTAADPDFDRIFVGGDPQDVEGKYFSRSPIMFVPHVKTPTLLIAGALDRCTPPAQALEFHRALIENGVESDLAIYPREGHGVREFESVVDYATRVVQWLDTHLKPADRDQGFAAERVKLERPSPL